MDIFWPAPGTRNVKIRNSSPRMKPERFRSWKPRLKPRMKCAKSAVAPWWSNGDGSATFSPALQYPDCKTTKPLKLGVKCPAEECGGDLVQKRTKRGRTFYSCSKYPTCKFALWDRPINRPCPKCQSPFLVEKYRKQSGNKTLCHNQECGYEETEETAAAEKA